MTIKDQKQQEFQKILGNRFWGIHLISMRVGKCRLTLNTIESFNLENPKILVLYPTVDIKKAWEEECDKINYHPDITYSTYLSIDKVLNQQFDFVVADEAQLCGEENQLPKLGELVRKHPNSILISGTYSKETLENLKYHTGMELVINYPTESAIKDGIISDFTIFIHQYSLDNKLQVEYGKVKKWMSTEQKECNRLSRKVDTSYGQEKMFHALNRMRFINSCPSLIKSVNNWIKNNQNQRFILFSGDENVGKNYNLPMYNSKSKTDKILQDFINGTIDQICLIRKGSTGRTYPSLDTILLTAINSNGEALEQQIGRGLLDDTEHTNVHIFISNQEFQLKWLNKALENISKDKIQWKTV